MASTTVESLVHGWGVIWPVVAKSFLSYEQDMQRLEKHIRVVLNFGENGVQHCFFFPHKITLRRSAGP